ncbi:lipid-A-disaccharide synthase-related protein [Phormidesmis sp. 146-35]
MRLLCLSNGHGEDAIATRVLSELQQQLGCPDIQALPIVGEGHAYQKLGIATIGTVQSMPSGGFIHMDSRQLVRDVKGGLVQLTIAQIKAIRTWAAADPKNSFILAVGDIVPLLFALVSGVPYAFVGTAKSEYYLRDESGWLPRKSWWDDRLERWTGCVYHPWERWLMSHPRCKAVFPRDRITANILQQFNVPAFDLGNPMMDGLEWSDTSHQPSKFKIQTALPLTIALIPGSRIPEAYNNWEIILQAINGMLGQMGRPILGLAAIAPGLELERFHKMLLEYRWQPSDLNRYTLGFGEKQATLELMPQRFAECLQRSDVAIALAGTATEQFIGLGKPAIIIPGQGPQFTPVFAEAQTRLLGASVTLVEQPNQVAARLKALLNNPDSLQLTIENGRRRMGEPGAAKRIAQCLLKQMDSVRE